MKCKKCKSNFRTIHLEDSEDRICYSCGHHHGKKQDDKEEDLK